MLCLLCLCVWRACMQSLNWDAGVPIVCVILQKERYECVMKLVLNAEQSRADFWARPWGTLVATSKTPKLKIEICQNCTSTYLYIFPGTIRCVLCVRVTGIQLMQKLCQPCNPHDYSLITTIDSMSPKFQNFCPPINKVLRTFLSGQTDSFCLQQWQVYTTSSHRNKGENNKSTSLRFLFNR